MPDQNDQPPADGENPISPAFGEYLDRRIAKGFEEHFMTYFQEKILPQFDDALNKIKDSIPQLVHAQIAPLQTQIAALGTTTPNGPVDEAKAHTLISGAVQPPPAGDVSALAGAATMADLKEKPVTSVLLIADHLFSRWMQFDAIRHERTDPLIWASRLAERMPYHAQFIGSMLNPHPDPGPREADLVSKAVDRTATEMIKQLGRERLGDRPLDRLSTASSRVNAVETVSPHPEPEPASEPTNASGAPANGGTGAASGPSLLDLVHRR
jgi:hypothetical protein